jgi:hypothetical protein
MENDLIILALQDICIRDNKELKEVHQYLLMKYRMDVDLLVLQRRLEKILSEEKAVA